MIAAQVNVKASRWMLAIAAVLTAVVCHCEAADAVLGPGYDVRLPDVGRRTDGFTLQVKLGRQLSVGYVPLKVTFNANGSLPADRRLNLRVESLMEAQTPPHNGMVINVPIEVAQGTTSQTFIRYLPKWSAGQAVELSVSEDGRELDNYSAVVGGQVPVDTGRLRRLLVSEHRTNWVVITDDASGAVLPSELQELWVVAELGVTQPPMSDRETMMRSQGRDDRVLTVVAQGDLPQDWRGYQRYDAVVVDMALLRQVRSAVEPALQVLRQWMLVGGTVVVYNASSPQQVAATMGIRWTDDESTEKIIATAAYEEQRLLTTESDSLQTDLGVTSEYVRIGGKISEVEPADMTPAQRRSFSGLVMMDADYQGNIELAQQDLDRMQAVLDRYLAIPEYREGHIWAQVVGAGRLIGIQASGQNSSPSLLDWRIVAKLIGGHASPLVRRGVDPMIGDRRFARWLIPGVAEPPVYTFMGLLTAFVVLVGPVAYRRTARHGRTYLMFAIAPMLALFTTVAMFGYGIVSDGFGTVVRVRQLTWVDGTSGDAGERVRATYFAGVRPAAGLRFPGDAEVFAYPEGTGMSWEELSQRSPASLGTVTIGADQQRFGSSFLPSRQQRQFVTHRPRAGVGNLGLVADPQAISAPTAENGFRFPLREAVIRDQRGVYWTVMRLRGGASMTCTPLPPGDASKALGRLYNEFRPLSRVRERSSRRRSYDRRIYDVLVDINRQLESTSTVTEGMFEQWLQVHLQTMGEIPPNHFVALADVSQDVLSVPQSEITDSVRYVFGTLR